MRAWALELECAGDGWAKEEEGVGKNVDPYPLIWVDVVVRPHQPSKTCLPPKRRDKWRGWVTHVRINENPVNKGDMISALTRRAKETASQNALWLVVGKQFE